jgi:hypothetical protein
MLKAEARAAKAEAKLDAAQAETSRGERGERCEKLIRDGCEAIAKGDATEAIAELLIANVRSKLDAAIEDYRSANADWFKANQRAEIAEQRVVELEGALSEIAELGHGQRGSTQEQAVALARSALSPTRTDE